MMGPGDSKFPPPLRSRVNPWGMKGLSSKNYDQLYQANTLLQTSLRFFVALIGAGGFAILEHPTAPVWKPAAPSIWYLAALNWIDLCPGVKKHCFNQGKHGQIAKKPTTFLTLRLPTIGRYLDKPQGSYAPLERVEQMFGKNHLGLEHNGC